MLLIKFFIAELFYNVFNWHLIFFVVDVGFEHIAVEEARRLKIPVIGIVDTNNNPDNIDYIIPANDDSMRAIRMYLSCVSDAITNASHSSGRGDAPEFIDA